MLHIVKFLSQKMQITPNMLCHTKHSRKATVLLYQPTACCVRLDIHESAAVPSGCKVCGRAPITHQHALIHTLYKPLLQQSVVALTLRILVPVSDKSLFLCNKYRSTLVYQLSAPRVPASTTLVLGRCIAVPSLCHHLRPSLVPSVRPSYLCSHANMVAFGLCLTRP